MIREKVKRFTLLYAAKVGFGPFLLVSARSADIQLMHRGIFLFPNATKASSLSLHPRTFS